MAQEYEGSDHDRQGPGGEQEEENRRKRKEQADALNSELGIDPGNIESFISGRNNYEGYLADQRARTTNTPGPSGDDEEVYSGQPVRGGSSIASWTGQPSIPDYTGVFREQMAQQQSWMNELREQEEARAAAIAAKEAEQKTLRDSLYNTWLQRSQASLDVNANDPIIKGQVDNYRAEQERALRNFRSDSAEGGNRLRPTQDRMAAERTAQNVGSMQSELLARELSTRRNEVADALNSMGGILTNEQQVGLQRELDNINNSLQRYQLGISDRSLGLESDLGFGRLGLDTELGRGGLALQGELGRGDLALRGELGRGQLSLDQLRNAMLNQQFYADMGFKTSEADKAYKDELRDTAYQPRY